MFSQNIGQKTNGYLNSAEQITKNWNVDQLSVLITSWDITYWCSVNLLYKELMERMSEHTVLISSYQLLITAARTNTGGKMKGSHSRAADRCPFVPRHSWNQVTSFMQLEMLCCVNWIPIYCSRKHTPFQQHTLLRCSFSDCISLNYIAICCNELYYIVRCCIALCSSFMYRITPHCSTVQT